MNGCKSQCPKCLEDRIARFNGTQPLHNANPIARIPATDEKSTRPCQGDGCDVWGFGLRPAGLEVGDGGVGDARQSPRFALIELGVARF